MNLFSFKLLKCNVFTLVTVNKIQVINSFSTGNKSWINRHINDQYVKKSFVNKLRSRAYFKLEEMQSKYKIITKTCTCLDLGCAPGGWSLFVANFLSKEMGNNRGLVIGVDLLPMESVDGVHFIQGDFNNDEIKSKIMSYLDNHKVDVILSDMLQNISGTNADHFRSIEICFEIFRFSETILNSGGNLVCKFLRGEDEKQLLDKLKANFRKVTVMKPRASRQESKEIYAIAQQFIR